MCGTDRAYAAIALRAPYAMSGTDRAYAATRQTSKSRLYYSSCRSPYAVSGTEYRRLLLPNAMSVYAAIAVRACYALSGTDDIADSGTALRVLYAMSGTDRAYAGIRPSATGPNRG
eukprot:896694-Rhodomonas_salina.2